MVLIESNEIEEKIIDRPEYSTNSTSESGANANRDVSDGFETASDGELEASDTDDEARHPKQLEAQQRGNKDKEEQQQQHQHERNVTEQEDDDKPIVSPTDDEEQKQKAMAQANDAKIEGNKLYGSGQYEDALSKYEFALYLAPEMPSSVELRSTCYSNRAICFLKLGKYTETVKECSKALELNPSYLKAMQRRAEAHEKLEHFEEAIADMKKILELDPSNDQARKSIRRLEPLAEQKREKMKEEMIGKLKEMGNSVLGRFGMSVDNFKAVKDPNTGSYSISFQR